MTDNNSQEVVRMSREFKFCMGCCWCGGGCCQMEIVVESPVGREYYIFEMEKNGNGQ
ncbi:hypothetical protein MAR_029991 [Mya arenaria]|uniref:Uncharacterized protein n=1 Tax=Mya arenaria TaxID=6604 RepID=A0ABY7DK40_MYAAR|nr:hypothetical protein MAR_029991 [Mya arenaria]